MARRSSAETPLLSDAVRERLLRVRLLACDIDGTLTDGGISYGSDGAEMRRFHIHDGLGIVVAAFVGLRIAWISGRRSPVVERRARDLGVTLLQEEVHDKEAALAQMALRAGVGPDETAYVGDDLNDLPALRLAEVGLAPADAVPEVRAAAHVVLSRPGGNGAVREAIELILRTRGIWDAALEAYLASLAASARKLGSP